MRIRVKCFFSICVFGLVLLCCSGVSALKSNMMQGDMDAWVMPPKMSAFSRIVCNGSVRLFID